MYALVAFDLDGTLVDSAPDLAHALAEALRSLGLATPTEDQTRSWIGGGIEVMIRRGMAESLGTKAELDTSMFEAALSAFDACYRANLFAKSRLYPNVLETLDWLSASGAVLGCITNKRVSFAEPLLELAGIRRRLQFVYGGDSFAEKKPSAIPLDAACAATTTDPAKSLLVGDSPHDMHAARAAGYDFIWAAYGYAAGMRWESPQPQRRIDRFSDLRTQLHGPP